MVQKKIEDEPFSLSQHCKKEFKK